ncbi:chemotaxis protein CheY [Candidatus Desulfofervidus auxilii]|uniref:Chemotaxis protein CheY n=1 Tax=Desulfofervidus auxilii TaxID=1621989 RepID=A0A7U4QIZ2_DESA2|nr:response regulator [Candidatus Desulfofervidus auxilii]AMM40237.1 chemotaxis protein CheY [Candidatus Desulfofervidus auxilii]
MGSKRILIVDDSPTLRASLRLCLKKAGYDIIEAEDGLDGLKKLNRLKREGSRVSLIISDVVMPKMDGITFVKKVKKTAFCYTPIIILTSERDEAKKQEGRKAGAAGWLVKPFKPQQLLWVIKKFVR